MFLTSLTAGQDKIDGLKNRLDLLQANMEAIIEVRNNLLAVILLLILESFCLCFVLDFCLAFEAESLEG